MGTNYSDLDYTIERLNPEQVIEVTEQIWGKTMFDIENIEHIDYLKQCLKKNKSIIKYNYIDNVSKSAF